MNTVRVTTVLVGSDTPVTHPGIPSEDSNAASRSSNANANRNNCQEDKAPDPAPKAAISCSFQDDSEGDALFLGKPSSKIRLKILIASGASNEMRILQEALEELNHRVLVCSTLSDATKSFRKWQPDLVVTEEGWGRQQPEAGLRLVEYSRMTEDQINGWLGTRTLLLMPVLDWERFKRAQRAGAHVILKTNLEAAIRYIQTIADDLVTDRILGPTLLGIHRFHGDTPRPKCENCEWVGASVSYGSSQADVRHLTPVRAAILNALLFRTRGQSPTSIMNMCCESIFLRTILGRHHLRDSAVRMEITRTRHNIDEALGSIGTPYSAKHFLPIVAHSVGIYRLEGNRRLIHVPSISSEVLDDVKPA